MRKNGVGPKPTLRKVGETLEWDVICYCGSSMVPVLLHHPDYVQECDIPNCASCAHDRFDGKPGAFYSCVRDGCDCLHSADRITDRSDPLKPIVRVGKPLGVTASIECQKLRHYAHIEFDHMWTHLNKSRPWAYGMLSRSMKLPIQQAHMAQFNIQQCRTAISIIRQFKLKKKIPLLLPAFLKID